MLLLRLLLVVVRYWRVAVVREQDSVELCLILKLEFTVSSLFTLFTNIS